MRISSIQNNIVYNQKSQTSFQAWERVVYEQPKSNMDWFLIKTIKHCNNTAMCRLPKVAHKPIQNYWEKFVDYLIDKYKEISKVNIYSLGCSNGAEAVTLVMGLKTALNKNLFSKFMPIKASDYDQTAIDYAKSGTISVNLEEAKRVDEFTNGQFSKFFYRTTPDENKTIIDYFKRGEVLLGGEIKPVLTDEEVDFHIKSEITENIEYKVANALEEVNNIQPDNNVINASNLWFYLGKEQAVELAKKLYNRLGKNSCVRVGDFDKTINIDKILLNAGFTRATLPYVYEKNL